MPLAKAQKRNPREVAAELIAALRAKTAVERWVESIAVAGPGFINLHLRAAARQRDRRRGPRRRRRLRHATRPRGDAVIVEFVSANPTGPLHVGHARQAALGDAICNLLETQGRHVVREFYYNDAGVQIATLAASVKARLDGLKPGDPGWPESAYNGDYIADIAADFAAGKTVQCRRPRLHRLGRQRRPRRASASSRSPTCATSRTSTCRRSASASTTTTSSRACMRAAGSRRPSPGWSPPARPTRTAARSGCAPPTTATTRTASCASPTARYTYFVPDVAYHLAKFERGFAKAINIQGTDHHGTIARVRAGLQAAGAGIPARYPDYVLNTMVRVERGGEEVKISKRAGSYVTLRDLIDWTSRDAVRFFMLSRKADTEFTFDVDLALKQNDENPVFYVQYAHARICSVLEQYAAQGGDVASLAGADLALLRRRARPRCCESSPSTGRCSPPPPPGWRRTRSRSTCASWRRHSTATTPPSASWSTTPQLARARLALLAATRQVIRNALALLGVSAPERMTRETDTA